jgi:hypothetical protein
MFLPIPGSKPRKWMRVVIHAIEQKWFDDYGEFYTYVIKNADIVEIVDEEELVYDIMKSVKAWIEDGYPLNELREQIAIVYGIPEKYIDLILERVKVELGLVEMQGMLIEPNYDSTNR